ncbi:sensor histidine kinase [Lentzea aerocolonigenes]|uniref:sensor histidine kinase n=1 Tax=Lentzea aerocolonigenes TaxID=68170 RepID=UPI0009E2781B|nr:HAMP domain-containing sensor histidine kinase [Lentzea aerocolonigenes]
MTRRPELSGHVPAPRTQPPDRPLPRRAGLSARLKLTLSYAGVVLITGAVLLVVVWMYLLRYVPNTEQGLLGISPNQYLLSRIFGKAAAVALAALLVTGLAGGWLLAGRMLSPLTQLADAARLASRGELSHRVRLPGRTDEFRELADAFDTMLEQLESHVAEQRRFAANASHELRTPLAITQSLLDVARQEPAPELIERLDAVNKRAIDLTEALLLLSRTGTFTRAQVDLSLVAEEAAETLLPFAEKREITLDVTGDATQTAGNAELLLRMVTNLVQNAIVHNIDGGSVDVRTSQLTGETVLRVENTGPLLPADLVPTLTEPFQRGAERTRTGEHAGAGLGLAIVASIVRAHDGILELRPRQAGGLVVTVRLPRVTRPGPLLPPEQR